MRYRMTIAYDGTAYAGWQVQPDARTLQGEVERHLSAITREPVRAHSSGRTDTGVHARGQVAHFEVETQIDPRRVLLGLNGLLDADIRILDLQSAADDFDARRSATGKQYRYFIWDGRIVPPWLRLYRAHAKKRLNVEAMQAAADRLVGRNDFAAFSANPNREVESTVRDLRRLQIHRAGDDVIIEAEGEGFLYKMVRSLAGFLIRVGHGDQNPEDAGEILASKVRTARVPTARPEGLFLWEVYY